MPKFWPSSPGASPPEDRIWEKEPDPRIKWALDLMDDEGYKQETLLHRLLWPATGLVQGVLGCRFLNGMGRKPFYANIPFQTFLIVSSLAFWEGLRKIAIHRGIENDALTRHYIMLHPEKFPEPEMKKFGDKEVMWEWSPHRGGRPGMVGHPNSDY